jgi:hypothetical protein
MAAELRLYEALVDAGVPKEKASAAALAQEDAMDRLLSLVATKAELSLVATKAELAEFRTYVDGRFNVVAEQFIQVRHEINSASNRVFVRLAALMVVLTGMLATLIKTVH